MNNAIDELKRVADSKLNNLMMRISIIRKMDKVRMDLMDIRMIEHGTEDLSTSEDRLAEKMQDYISMTKRDFLTRFYSYLGSLDAIDVLRSTFHDSNIRPANVAKRNAYSQWRKTIRDSITSPEDLLQYKRGYFIPPV